MARPGRPDATCSPQALDAGHEVTALVRGGASRVSVAHPQLSVIIGDATDRQALDNALRGNGAILSALGAGNSLRSDIASRAMSTLIPAMRAQGSKRVIFLSAFGAGESYRQASFVQKLIYRTLLTDSPRTRSYRVGEAVSMKGIAKIGRADVAAFIVAQLDTDAWVRKTAVLTY